MFYFGILKAQTPVPFDVTVDPVWFVSWGHNSHVFFPLWFVPFEVVGSWRVYWMDTQERDILRWRVPWLLLSGVGCDRGHCDAASDWL